jgi:hypothetical protein
MICLKSIPLTKALFCFSLQIIPNGEEIVPAVLAFAEELVANPLEK